MKFLEEIIILLELVQIC